MQKRNWFKQMFKKEMPTTEISTKQFELLSSASSTYIPFGKEIFSNDIVRSALRPKANAVGKTIPRQLNAKDEEIANDILKRPNPYMSMQDFLAKMVYQREIHNNAFAYLKRDGMGRVIEIYPINYASVELIDVVGEVYCRFQFLMGKHMTVPYTDLIHLRKDFFKDDFYGENGTVALHNLMEVINATDQSVVNAVKNSAVIKWIMKFKNTLRPEDVSKQVKDFTKNYLDISNTGGAAYSDPKYDLEQVKESNYVPSSTQMKEAKERVYSYFGVNEAIVQNKYTEDQYLAFYEAEIEPIVIQLSKAFTNAFFSRNEIKAGKRIIFDATNLSFASMDTKLRLVDLLDRGIMSQNEIRKVLNLPAIENGDNYYMRLDTAPIKAEVEEVKTDEEK